MGERKNIIEDNLETKFIPLSEAALRSGYTPEHLNLLSRKGVLKAKKIGRNWHTTQEWLEEFMESIAKKKGGKSVPAENVEVSCAAESFHFRDLRETEEEKSGGYGRYQDEAGYEILERLEKIETGNFKNSVAQIFTGLVSLAVVVPVIFVFVSFSKYQIAKHEEHKKNILAFDEMENFVIGNENGTEDIASGKISGIVAGEETQNQEADKSGVVLASENFRARAVAIGGDVIALSNGENEPIEITDVRSESFISNKKDEVKLVLNWKTNKMAASEIEYSKNNGQNPKKVREQSYGFSHSVVLTDLEPRTSYVYLIRVRDRWGNEIESNTFGIYTAAKPVSVFDMIAKAVGETFGWAISK